MSMNQYFNAKGILHGFSATPVMQGQEFTDQGLARGGHNVTAGQVRAQLIPAIATRSDAQDYLQTDNGLKSVGGLKGKPYKGIMKYIEKAKLVAVPNTNGQAYTLAQGTRAIQDIIDPADMPVDRTTLSQGYRLTLRDSEGIEIPYGTGWSFDSFAGILHFPADFNPTTSNWTYGALSGITASVFEYTGTYVNQYLPNIANMIAVQPFKFTTDEMTKDGNRIINGAQKLQWMKITIPALCFQIQSIDFGETILTETYFNIEQGSTTIRMVLPWNDVTDKPVRMDAGQVKSDYSFIAFSFVTNTGNRIAVKPTVEMKNITQYNRALGLNNSMTFTVNPSTTPTVVQITTPITVNAYAQE